MNYLWAGADRLVTEDELHGYVDRQVAASRRPAVSRYLLAHPEEALRVKAYTDQRDTLRALLAAQVGEAVSPRLDLRRLMQDRLGAHETPFGPAVCA
jgi:anti-sigma factor RsiW